jgi:putative hydrolase of the HAD superfamily
VIKALIFDFDGLIMDTESPEVDGWKAIYAEYGQEFPLQVWIRDVVGSTISNFDPAAHLAAITGLTLDLSALHARAYANRLEKQGTLSALPGVYDYVKTARRLGLRLAVASSSRHAWVEGYLRQLGLFNNFEAIVCREDAPHVKPEPDLFLAALDALKLPADEALVFEDSPNGILSARRAGMRVVAVPNPITAHGAMEGASLVLASLAEMPLEELMKQIEIDNRQEHWRK